jgi:AcrR family transcriptional regulator
VLSAAVSVISTHGYNAANIQLILDTSKVVRGSVLHQFPTRLDLMLGVLDYAHDELIKRLRSRLAERATPREQLESFLDAVWELTANDPMGTVVSEIQDAAHWDKDLARLIAPASDRTLSRLNKELQKIAQHAGIRDVAMLGSSLLVMVAAVRGLTIGFRVNRGKDVLASALTSLRTYWLTMIEQARSQR